MSKFLLLLGPSGVGKSSIIKELLKLDKRFVYISPFMTRKLREGEKDKVSINNKEMDSMLDRGEILAINKLYGSRYATPRKPIMQALENEKFPVLDWPISQIKIMLEKFPKRLCIIYVLPSTIGSLKERLAKDERNINENRLQGAREELKRYKNFKYAGICDFEIVSEENKILEISRKIYKNYLNFIK